MSEKKFYEEQGFKEWLEGYYTKAFFRSIEEAVEENQEKLKDYLINTKPDEYPDIMSLKNQICWCQAQINVINFYKQYKQNQNEQ